MRDLVVNAPARLDGLTQQMVELTARIAPAEQRMTELHNEFDPSALTSVATNVTTAKDRLAFADQNLSRARDLAAKPVSGEQSGLVDAVQAAESALGQARALLDAVDSAANDIRHAVATLPSLIADIQTGIEHADTQMQQRAENQSGAHPRIGQCPPGRGEQSPRRCPRKWFGRPARRVHPIDQGRRRPESAAGHRRRRAGHRRATQPHFRASIVHGAVADSRRLRIHRHPPRQHRTRGADPSRRGQPAPGSRLETNASTDVSEAITHANTAATLAAQAQSLANDDVQSAQLAYTGRYGGGNHMGAMMGGIIIGDMLGGGGLAAAAGARRRSAVRRVRSTAASWAAADGSEASCGTRPFRQEGAAAHHALVCCRAKS